MEEFNERARSEGSSAARRWYWREALRNAGILALRPPKLEGATAAIASLIAIHAAMILAAAFAWNEWAIATAPIVNGLSVAPWMRWYGWSWCMAFPPAGLDSSREFYVAIAAGFGFALIFARHQTMHIQAFRRNVLCTWLLISAWFMIYSLFVVRTGTMWHASQRLIVDFGMRESLAALAFWIGTYLAVSLQWFQQVRKAHS
jgi:hypothetical protein